MKLTPLFCCIFTLIIPMSILAQIDTLKPGFGINNLQFGLAKPSDIYTNYDKKLVRILKTKNPNYKRLQTNRTIFYFVRVDSVFLLERIKIQPNCKKFYLQKEFVFSKRTRVKDLISAFGTPRIAHLSKINSVVYDYTILRFDGFSCYVAPSKDDLIETSSSPLSEDLLEDYMNSKIKKLFISCPNCTLPFYPNSFKSKAKVSLSYSKHKHYAYYKDQDSLIRIEANSGCVECSYLPYFNINYYTKKQRIKTRYILSGFIPLRAKVQKLPRILNNLKKGALKKKEYFYFGKHRYTILWRRKNIRSLYYISEIWQDLL